MKNLIIGIAIAAITFSACNNNSNKEASTSAGQQTNDPATIPQQNSVKDSVTDAVFSTKEIIAGYLQLKNALAKDNAKDAAAAGSAIVASLAQITATSLPADKQKVYAELQDDIKEHVEHIGANAGKIEHQREHFIMLSKDVSDLVKEFGNNGRVLYKDFCPMANEGKGAIWISEVKEIQNPYLGSKMPDCGTLKETIK